MLIPEGTEFTGVRAATLVSPMDRSAFWRAESGSLMVEPAGTIRLPRSVVTDGQTLPRAMPGRYDVSGGHRFADEIDYPALMISKFGPAWCLPFAPPVLIEQRKLVTDFLIPWSAGTLGWFEQIGDSSGYRTQAVFDTDHVQYELDTALYLDHAVIGHYGHFVADCLSRMYAWDICRSLFGAVNVIVADTHHPDVYHTRLLQAAGVPADAIVKIDGLVRCRRLLLATNSFAVLQYVSSTAPRLWATIRDAVARRDVAMPDRVYLSRSGVDDRPLVNEAAVEEIFRRRGFVVARPETLPVDMQVALACNARLVAGPSGSNLFNLAFQGRMRSVFVLAPDFWVGPSEQFFCAGHFCDLRYHLGRQVGPDLRLAARSWQVDTARLAAEVDDWLTAAEG